MPRFYEPDIGSNPEDPFVRDGENKLVRRGFWSDLSDQNLIYAMTQGIGEHLTNEQKRAHLNDLGRSHLIEQICIQEILPPAT